MRKIEYWKAFDNAIFFTEEDCRAYELKNPLFDSSKIVFLANDGTTVPTDEYSLLESNFFKVFDQEALSEYIKYCNDVGISAPTPPRKWDKNFYHFIFDKGSWFCFEQAREDCKDLEKWF